mmetsp:Transcript_64787/g.173854  ORF Transcript_64787/g.173854 Transcript_64787/m.173854 type:complete len:177 (+) Transcript_64787:573-1103(+)
MTRQVITWTPARGTESRTWKVCVKVHDPTFTAWFILRCSSLTVAKCAMCGNAGDTLGSIAQAYGTNWMQLWGANIGSVGTVPAYFPASPTGTAAAVVASSTDADAASAAMGFGSFPDGALRLGPTYITSSAIPPALLARRFGMSLSSLFRFNPDLDPSLDSVPQGFAVCIVSQICE